MSYYRKKDFYTYIRPDKLAIILRENEDVFFNTCDTQLEIVKAHIRHKYDEKKIFTQNTTKLRLL